MFKRRVIATAAVLAAVLLFAVAFAFRTTVVPLHWAALWLVPVTAYVAAAVSFRPERSIRILGPLFPLFLLFVLEMGWTAYDYVAARSGPSVAAGPAPEQAPPGARLQSEIDGDYNPITMRVEFIPDGIRVLKLPSNYRTPAVNTNSLGFRGGEFGAKRDGVFRIIVMGDSGLFGWNAPDDYSTIPAQLQKILNDRIGGAKRFEVLNMGIPSGISTFHYATFATYGQSLDPDFLIMFLGLNDLGGSNVAMPATFSERMKRYLSLYSFKAQVLHLFRETASTLDLILRRLRSYKAIVDALAPPKKSFVGDTIEAAADDANFQRYADVYMTNLERIYRLANKLDIGFATFEQPSLQLGLAHGTALSPRDLARRDEERRDHADRWRNLTEKYPDIVARGGGIARRYGGEHYGLADMLARHDGPMYQSRFAGYPENSLFVTGAHYTRFGLNLIAEEIYARIGDRLRDTAAR